MPSSVSHSKNSFKGFSKLWVEDCIDDGVNTGVNVAKEGSSLEGNVARGGVEVVLDTEASRMLQVKKGTQQTKKPAAKHYLKFDKINLCES